jgi:hypothetical protein
MYAIPAPGKTLLMQPRESGESQEQKENFGLEAAIPAETGPAQPMILPDRANHPKVCPIPLRKIFLLPVYPKHL